MKILLALVIFAAANVSFADCKEVVKAANKVMSALEDYEVNALKHMTKTIDKSRESIKKGEFCPNSDVRDFFGYLKRAYLCTTITAMASLVPGGDNHLEAADPANQAALENAMLEFGRFFPSSEETEGFSCDLKTLRYNALK